MEWMGFPGGPLRRYFALQCAARGVELWKNEGRLKIILLEELRLSINAPKLYLFVSNKLNSISHHVSFLARSSWYRLQELGSSPIAPQPIGLT